MFVCFDIRMLVRRYGYLSRVIFVNTDDIACSCTHVTHLHIYVYIIQKNQKIPRSECSIRLDVHAFKKQHTIYPKKVQYRLNLPVNPTEIPQTPNSKVNGIEALKALDILEAIGLEDEQQLLAVMRSARSFGDESFEKTSRTKLKMQ